MKFDELSLIDKEDIYVTYKNNINGDLNKTLVDLSIKYDVNIKNLNYWIIDIQIELDKKILIDVKSETCDLYKLQELATTENQKKVCESLINNDGDKLKVCKDLNIRIKNLTDIIVRIKKHSSIDLSKKVDENKYNINDDKVVIHKLKDEIKSLKSALDNAKSDIIDASMIKDIIFDVDKKLDRKCEVPEWVNNKTKSKIVPVINITDVHIGERVNPEDVNFVNEYNTDLACYRVNKCVDDFIGIYRGNFTNYEYDGVVCNVLGDIITGELHDLAETNDKTSVDQIIVAVQLIEEQLRKLHKSFGKVLVNMVSGNHGRSQPLKYTKNNNRYNNSLEKIVYTFVEHNMQDVKDDVCFNTSPEDVLRVSINGHRFKLMHGDTIKTTGTAIAGPSTSFARAFLKHSSVGASTNASFDTMIIGHFHNHYYAQGVMVCNSTKGYDTYCAMLGINFSLPGCTSFAVNSHGQIIFFTDIQVRKDDTKDLRNFRKSIEIF